METYHIYDGIIQQRDGNNVPTYAYTRGNDLSVSLEGAGGIGGLLARSDGYSSGDGSWSSNEYYYADGNGNISSLTDGSQNIVASYRYDPFGNIISKSGSLADANVYRFSSKEVHVKSGMYYYGFRFYDPNLQRWINRDPMGERGGLNLYGFVGNSPVEFVDPLGLQDAMFQMDRTVPDDFIGPLPPGWLRGSENAAMASKMGLQPSLLGELLIPSGVGAAKCIKPSALSGIGKAESMAVRAEQLGPKAAQSAQPALRQAYEKAVRDLASRLSDLRRAGKDPEAIARELSQAHRSLGEKFKDLTPPNFRQKIYQRNLGKYGDPLGPTVEQLRASGKTWEEIAEGACRSGGTDLGF